MTHRIIEITEDGYFTKGDYNNTRDSNIVKQEQIVGKVVFNSYTIGYVFANYRYYIIFLIIFAMIVLNMAFIMK